MALPSRVRGSLLGGGLEVPQASVELAFAGAVEAAAAIRSRRVSSVELTHLTLARIGTYNAALNAVVNVLTEDALAAARAADEAIARGAATGPLHGVPVLIKDAFEIRGVRTTAGAPPLKDYVPTEDSEAVARLRTAGAVILGNTNVPPMLGDWQSDNPIYGRTNNPWDLGRTPGGSSGGSAAALAAGFAYLAMGSDIGGSIRVPAHFCGVYGLKPTLELVPQRGHIPPPPFQRPQPSTELAVAGPMARTAPDLALALEVLGGPAAPEAIAYRWRLPAPRHYALRQYRVGYVLDDPRCPVGSDVKAVLARAVEALGRSGVRLERGWPPEVDPWAQYRTYYYLLMAAIGAPEDDEVKELPARAAAGDDSLAMLRARALTDTHARFREVQAQRLRAQEIWQGFFRDHDGFLMPTAFVPAFPHDGRPWNERRLRTPEGERAYEELLFWISFATMTGLPAVTAPVGLTGEGLPVGIQIMGPYLEDATPIDLAARMGDVVGGFERPPAYA